jgi:hypothetical protein
MAWHWSFRHYSAVTPLYPINSTAAMLCTYSITMRTIQIYTAALLTLEKGGWACGGILSTHAEELPRIASTIPNGANIKRGRAMTAGDYLAAAVLIAGGTELLTQDKFRL